MKNIFTCYKHDDIIAMIIIVVRNWGSMNNESLRGYNDIIILSILISADSYGYQISRKIAMRSKSQYIIKEATMYSALNRLEKLGFITSYNGSESNGSPRTYYKLTQAGERYYLDKRTNWIETVEIMNDFLGGDRGD